ncbi:MAG: glycosyltransferase family 4 protein [Candidatus Bruticola sp.]
MCSSDQTMFGVNKVQFVMLSFEGPDLFAMAGGLGIRAQELCGCLASMGYSTHLYFIGDPDLPAEENRDRLVLHRWCQWISAANPGGCYVNEEDKVRDFASSIPSALVEQIIAPAASQGITTVVLAEEWQTIPAVINLSELVKKRNLQNRTVILWNTNNLYGFEGIDWNKLQDSCFITTVSRYMKHRMWILGVNPIVVHNGIPGRLLHTPIEQRNIEKLRAIFPDPLLIKVGRYDTDKRWVMAIQAVAAMKRQGLKPTLIARGGKEPHRHEVKRQAELNGLTWKEIHLPAKAAADNILAELECYKDYDILELCFYVSEDFINVLYAGSDCVLANSGHEPFGLVGLEVMACGGLAFVGSTGEDYAQTLVNSAVVETEDPLEIVEYARTLMCDKSLNQSLREEGRRTAACYTWERILRDLFQKIRFMSVSRGIILD